MIAGSTVTWPAAPAAVSVSPPGGAGGDLFGLAVSLNGRAVYYVNDGNNSLYSLS